MTTKAALAAHEIAKFFDFEMGSENEDKIAEIISEFFPAEPEDGALAVKWADDVRELLKMYLLWNPATESLQFRLYKVVQASNKAHDLNQKSAEALHKAVQHVKGNINRAKAAGESGVESFAEDEKIICDTYDQLIGYSQASEADSVGQRNENQSLPLLSEKTEIERLTCELEQAREALRESDGRLLAFLDSEAGQNAITRAQLETANNACDRIEKENDDLTSENASLREVIKQKDIALNKIAGGHLPSGFSIEGNPLEVRSRFWVWSQGVARDALAAVSPRPEQAKISEEKDTDGSADVARPTDGLET